MPSYWDAVRSRDRLTQEELTSCLAELDLAEKRAMVSKEQYLHLKRVLISRTQELPKKF